MPPSNVQGKPSAGDPLQLGLYDPRYPPSLTRYLADRAPEALTVRGNLDLLRQPALAFFCSAQCPGALVLRTYDLARALRDAGIPVIGGFHSPMEQEALALLVRGRQPVIVCLARDIAGMKLPAPWQAACADGRLLLLSPFDQRQRRITSAAAQVRNSVVAALAAAILVVHATPGGKTEAFCREVVAWGKPLLTLDGDNAQVRALGARAIGAQDAPTFLPGQGAAHD